MEHAPENPETLEEFLWYIKRYEHGIFFRRKVNDKWCNLSLAELDPKDWAKTIVKFITEGSLPVRVREDSEI